MNQRQILVAVRTNEEESAELEEVWQRIKQGLPPIEPVHRLYFFEMETLTKCLSPKRLELLKMLRDAGPMNIRQLAKKLERNYSNVHQDITDLESLGLVDVSKRNSYSVPWDSIIMELSSTPAAISA